MSTLKKAASDYRKPAARRSVEVRPVTSADLHPASEVLSVWQQETGQDKTAAEDWHEWLTSSGVCSATASVGARHAGIILYDIGSDPFTRSKVLTVRLLYVVQSCRRRGSGSALLQYVAREAERRRISTMLWDLRGATLADLEFADKTLGDCHAPRQLLLTGEALRKWCRKMLITAQND